jgi:glycosyltransferase involved in cell wall biosynthesis
MKVLFLTKYVRLGASSRYRTFQYFPYLEAEGIQCETSSLFADDYLVARYSVGRPRALGLLGPFYGRLRGMGNFRKFDLVVVEKELFPYLPAGIERWMLRKARAYSLDLDDALFHIYDQHSNPLVKHVLTDKFASLMKDAALVTVGNPYIEKYALNYSRHVEVLPTVIDVSRYPLNPEPEGPFTVGWIGTPHTSRYIKPIEKPLRRFFEKRKGRLLIIGADRDYVLDDVPTEVLPWKEDDEVSFLQRIHVGIMPLPDSPLQRGKSGLKLLQYMACGKPVIASPVGVNAEIVTKDVGFLAASDNEWYERLVELADNPALRRELGRRGRLIVEAHYNLAKWAERYAHMLKAASEDGM